MIGRDLVTPGTARARMGENARKRKLENEKGRYGVRRFIAALLRLRSSESRRQLNGRLRAMPESVIALLVVPSLLAAASARALSAGMSVARGNAPPSLRLSLDAVRVNLTEPGPAKVRITLRNVSRSDVTLDGRLVPGRQVQLYGLDWCGKPIKLIYPQPCVQPPSKCDFVTLAPGRSVTRPMDVKWSMLPDRLRQSGWFKFAVRVTTSDSGSRLGLRAWTGSLKAYVRLLVTTKLIGPRLTSYWRRHGPPSLLRHQSARAAFHSDQRPVPKPPCPMAFRSTG